MPIEFTCIHCGASNEAADEYAGQTGPCAGCRKTIVVPPLTRKTPHRPVKQRSLASLAIGLVVWGLVALLLVALILPAFQGVRKSGRSPCSNNLKQIGLALHNYHNGYGSFPPAYIPDEDGRPMHSWRVLILPFLEQRQLCEQYDFNEPWNSPHNLDVAGEMPPGFHCPKDKRAGRTDTSYVMLVGPGAFSEGATPTTIADFADGTSNTIAVVEMSDSGILWTEPRDLHIEGTRFMMNDNVAASPRSRHPGGVNTLSVDASVRYISDEIPPEQLNALITRAGGESTKDFDY